ncbi:MAG: cyclodeaminase/cyclohydrolase family protein [Lachnospiraceae bacterium]|nr:cyclodeaminase/cyclohydrolase family protein [Lachnospiraceae bacterium]
MLEQKTIEFLDVLSSSAPVPGGGGASAAVGAFASALGMMVTNLTIGKKKYIDVEAEMEDIRSRLESLQQELVGLTDRDAEAFEPLSRAYGLPKETEEQRIEKERVMEKALYEASVVPLQIMKTVFRVMEDLEVLGEKGSRLAVSDVGVAVLFARAALEGASLNIYINTRLMKNREQAERLNQESDELITEAGRLQEKIYTGVLAKIR